MLTLPIKKHWYDKIRQRIKLEEYRNMTPYYASRLVKYVGKELIYKLRNGYSKKSPTLTIRGTVTMDTGREDWGAEKNVSYYVLKVYEILEETK